MPRKRFNRSMVPPLFGLLLAALAAILAAAAPAYADGDRCCQVSIDNMPRQFHSGSDPTPFILHVANQTQETLRYLNVSFVLQANDLVGDLVHLQRQRVLGGPHNVGTFTQHGMHSGAVTADDQIDFGTLALPPGGDINVQYQLSFSQKMPSTGLTLSVQVQPKRSDKGISTAGPYQSTIAAAGQSTQIQPDPTPTPIPTATATPAASDAAGAAVAPTGQSSLIAGSSSGGGSLMWLTYTIGALFLLGGVGLAGTLLWRRGPHKIETDRDGPHQYGQPIYPTQPLGGHAAQTRVVPVVYGSPGRHTPRTAQSPVVPQDPFADPGQTWIDPPGSR